MKRYRPYSPEQPYLLPPSPREWLPSGHLARFVLDLVCELYPSAIETTLQAKDPRGERSYAPIMMTALLIDAYATGVYASRQIERATVEDVACWFLAAGEHPHVTTINQFRARHRQALADLFVQVLRACQAAGLVKLAHVAIDGTKMKANASKHKGTPKRPNAQTSYRMPVMPVTGHRVRAVRDWSPETYLRRPAPRRSPEAPRRSSRRTAPPVAVASHHVAAPGVPRSPERREIIRSHISTIANCPIG